MESWTLTINHPHGGSYTHRFKARPKEVVEGTDAEAYCFEGEGQNAFYRVRGLKEELVRVEDTGPIKVWINARGVINWFIKRDDLDWKEK